MYACFSHREIPSRVVPPGRRQPDVCQTAEDPTPTAAGRSPASRRGQDKRGFCRSAAIYHKYDIIMA